MMVLGMFHPPMSDGIAFARSGSIWRGLLRLRLQCYIENEGAPQSLTGRLNGQTLLQVKFTRLCAGM